MKKTNLIDATERKRALDPTQSFIVQAPAGSGKTEILTQRYLTLLAHVEKPEEILAITFTKKAAAEMRDRILSTLQAATVDTEVKDAHALHTRAIAKKALERNDQLEWHLAENPNRLKIHTIDAFNAYLAKCLPLLSQLGGMLEITNDPSSLYREAVQELLSYLEENTAWTDAIETLLLHLDNDVSRVENLLINMLKRRDQWLPYIAKEENPLSLRDALESSLKTIQLNALQAIEESLPKQHARELFALAEIAANTLTQSYPESLITACKEPNHPQFWRGIATLLLTKDFQWRKRLDATIGFPPPSKAVHSDEKNYYSTIKERMLSLLEQLSPYDHFRQTLIDYQRLPDQRYQEKQWVVLAALYPLLKVAVAQLKITFQHHGQMDYIENAEAALTALGTDQAPTDLLLTLDYKIKHILVDEFQDTSNSQFRLLEKLIQGWERNDGRTLFLVGDPMQSIYRFREAEVGLFLRARQQGIASLKLEPLTLKVNFRSGIQVVEWVNEQFQSIFPKKDDITTGAISFSSSASAKEDLHPFEAITLHPCFEKNELSENEKMVHLIQSVKSKKPDATIAILVRSRTHLRAIIPALKNHAIPYSAVDIDPLFTRPVIQDLLSLTKALLHPAHRVAWLSILRAPWCGLSLSDLWVIANHSKKTIWSNLKDLESIQHLSEDGRNRLLRIIPILNSQWMRRRQRKLSAWVEETWIHLGGSACVNTLSDLEDAETFFKHLDALDQGGDLLNGDELDNAISRLYASPSRETDTTLQIMTIHNAKGLEFDVVILPHLEAKPPHDDKPLLLWMEQPSLHAINQLIMAPIHAVGDETDSIYDYIKRQQSAKSDHEAARLLYVAVTRAKSQLHLFFSLSLKSDGEIAPPVSKSLLEKLWPKIQSHIHLPSMTEENPLIVESTIMPIKRLTLAWKNPLSPPTLLATAHHRAEGFLSLNSTARQIGILIHQWFEHIANKGFKIWESRDKQSILPLIKSQLLQLGILPHLISDHCERVYAAITNTLNDPRGRWILSPHTYAQTEYAITAVIDNTVKPFIIDRTFIDEKGTRWIIDYKSSQPDHLNLADFIHQEHEKYAQQLITYQQAFALLDSHPIRLGLYFPLIPHWHELSIEDITA